MWFEVSLVVWVVIVAFVVIVVMGGAEVFAVAVVVGV